MNEQEKQGGGEEKIEYLPAPADPYPPMHDAEIARLLNGFPITTGRSREPSAPEGMVFIPAAPPPEVGSDGKPRTPSTNKLAKQPKFGPDSRKFDLDDAGDESPEEIEADPLTSSLDYDPIFRGDGYDSFDFAYDEYGNPIGALVPKAAIERDREAEERAALFAESAMRKIEKRIGGPIERADTSALHNDKSLLQRAKEVFAPPKRRVIHDPDELI